MNALIKTLLYLVGVALWLPGLALINIGEAWGLQIATALTLLLLLAMSWTFVIQVIAHKPLVINRDWLVIHGVVLMAAVLSTLFSSIGIARSAQTFATEMVGFVFTLTMAWAFVTLPTAFTVFVRGFRRAGVIFSAYAVYQLLAFRLGLPFAYLPMNNASFAVVDEGSALFLGRALGLTPEPSILASLMLPLVGVFFSGLLVQGGLKQYALFGLAVAGFLATGSQSIALAPLYLLVIIVAQRKFSHTRRQMNTSDRTGLCALLFSVVLLLSTNPAIVSSLSRLDLDTTATASSFAWRLNDFLTSLEMFRQSPLVGMGLGAQSMIANDIKQSLGLAGAAGASSGVFRMIGEQGLAGLFTTLFTTILLFPRQLRRASSVVQHEHMLQHIALLAGMLISLTLFVGYRNVYHLWLLIPFALSFKRKFRALHTSPVSLSPRLLPAIATL